MADDKPRTCGQVFVKKLNKKIWVHAKKGESCEEARKRVAEKWDANPQEVSVDPSENSQEGRKSSSEVTESAD
jgi:hypothetical protein